MWPNPTFNNLQIFYPSNFSTRAYGILVDSDRSDFAVLSERFGPYDTTFSPITGQFYPIVFRTGR